MADEKLTAQTAKTTVNKKDIFYLVTDPTGSPLGRKITGENLLGGWIEADTWAYASATTITVPSGAASIYSVGDKIKLTQTTVKYFYILSIADTVLTVTGGSDYTVANAAITLPNYSKSESPVGFPQFFNLTAPTFDVAFFDDGAGGQPTTTETRLCIKGRTCFVHWHGSGTKAGTDDTSVSFPDTAFPPINTAEYPSRTTMGPGHVFQTGVGHTIMTLIHTDSSSVFQGKLTANINDNQALGDVSFQATYEI